MTESVTIRQATAADRAAIGRLWRELMEFHYQFDSRAFGLAPNAVDIWLHQLDECITDDEHLVLVAKAEDQLVGYAMGEVSEGRPMFRHGPYGHIGTFCVTANWRRRGIGRRMVERLLEWFRARGISEVRVTAWYSNPASNAFWRSLGFQPKTVGMNLLVDPIADVE
jgi:ribosomal protein S18 acetylase RimI-like enzyme